MDKVNTPHKDIKCSKLQQVGVQRRFRVLWRELKLETRPALKGPNKDMGGGI